MAEERLQRRLVAVLSADVVGYTRLMEQDESGTLAALKACRRDILDPLVAEHQGRIFKTTGDGFLVEFASAVNAVHCAVDLQRAMANANERRHDDGHIVLRIGISLGDVVVEDDELFGDGVNIAARLEALADPGGVLVSGTVYDHIKSKVKAAFDDLGARSLKNVAEPIRIYRVADTPLVPAAPSRSAADKASIAVLPFTNMSGDPEQEYFSDGIVEEIITELSRFRNLFVIARNSSFIYKGRAVDIKDVGRELGVRYVLEGSVRKSGARVRIIAQLIEASSGAHLWADRFEGALENIFDLQDQITKNVVGAIALKLEQAEIDRARRKPTASLDAYDCYLRGLAAVHRFTRQDIGEALALFNRAIELDPNFAAAYGVAARCYAQRKAGRWMDDAAAERAEAARLARRAIELAEDDALVLSTAGFALADVAEELEEGDGLIDLAIELNPNLAWAWIFSGWVKISLGQPEAGIERISQAMRLSPHDPYIFGMQSAMASAHLAAGRYEEALSWAAKASRTRPQYLLAACIMVVCNALAGRLEQAGKELAKLRQIDPDLRISNLRDVISYLRPRDFEKWVDGLRKAGLPE